VGQPRLTLLEDPTVSTGTHDQIVLGKGHISSLRVVQRERKSTTSSSRARQCTGVFVSRFAPRTSSNQIQQHIRHETGLSIRAEKLDTRYNSYSSFYIPGDRRTRDQLMTSDLWPVGTLIKLFFN
jgi:hypothetical protein